VSKQIHGEAEDVLYGENDFNVLIEPTGIGPHSNPWTRIVVDPGRSWYTKNAWLEDIASPDSGPPSLVPPALLLKARKIAIQVSKVKAQGHRL
jgi:hypothetical protein